MVVSSNRVAVTKISGIAPVSSKDFLDIQATIKCRFNLKHGGGIIITQSIAPYR